MDEKLFFLINHDWTHPALDRVMVVMSSYDFWSPFLILALVVMAWRGRFRARAALIALAVVLLALNFGVELAKPAFDRPRPNQHLAGVRWIDLDPDTSPRFLALGKPLRLRVNAEPLPVAKGKGRSFPSGHTVMLFGSATVMAVFFGRRGALTFLVALLVGYSRVYTGSHHPSDVLVTALFAVAGALAVLAILGGIWTLAGPRLLPRLHADHPALFGEKAGAAPPA